MCAVFSVSAGRLGAGLRCAPGVVLSARARRAVSLAFSFAGDDFSLSPPVFSSSRAAERWAWRVVACLRAERSRRRSFLSRLFSFFWFSV